MDGAQARPYTAPMAQTLSRADPDLLLGVDIGTQGVKGVLIDEELRVVGHAYAEHGIAMPRPGWAEQDAEAAWWRGFLRIVRRLLREAPAQRIRGVGCSGMSVCVLPCEGATPLRPAILYRDARAAREIEELRELTAQGGFDTRHPFSTQSVVPKLMWLARHEPDVLGRATHLFTAANFLTYRLTGRYTLDYCQASYFEPLYSYENRRWSNSGRRLAGLPDLPLPALAGSSEPAGAVTPAAARACGLVEGTPVAVGSSDGISEIVSLGGGSPGLPVLLYGSSGVIGLETDRTRSLGTSVIIPHPLRLDRSMLLSGPTAAAILTRWFADTFGAAGAVSAAASGDTAGTVAGSGGDTGLTRRPRAYEALSRAAARIPPGSEGLIALPYFAGERHPFRDPAARGVLFGLTLSHTREHLYRALLEGVAYSFRHNLEELTEGGERIREIVAGGGGSRNEIWVQIVSDVCGYDQLLPPSPGGSEVGAAVFAGLCTGSFKRFGAETGDIILRGAKRVRPRPEAGAVYAEIYPVFRELYERLAPDLHRLADG